MLSILDNESGSEAAQSVAWLVTEGVLNLQRSWTKEGFELNEEENKGCKLRIPPQLQKEIHVRLAALYM